MEIQEQLATSYKLKSSNHKEKPENLNVKIYLWKELNDLRKKNKSMQTTIARQYR